MMPPPSTDIAMDVVILGGGLSGGLIALALAARRPELSVMVVERGQRFGGNHVWSFFASDVPGTYPDGGPSDDPGDDPGGGDVIEPLIAARWDGYEVRFPGRMRRLATPYRSATSARLDAALRAALPQERLLTGAEITSVGARQVGLADGRTITAGAVIDARGATGMPHMAGGWQKFAGQMLRLEAPHGLDRPVVMDATVAQHDGYRFVYALPFSPTEVFVEDTYYADGPVLDLPVLRERISAYAAAQGWRVAAIDYEETGVLPVIAQGDFEAFWRAMGPPGTARAGVRAALVHPLTSYSLPFALRFALHLCTLDNLSAESLQAASHEWSREHWRRGRFYRMLTRMLYGAAAPSSRYKVLERFYGLPESLIERFYAGRSTTADMLRILAGKPPVPVGAAIASLLGQGRPLGKLG